MGVRPRVEPENIFFFHTKKYCSLWVLIFSCSSVPLVRHIGWILPSFSDILDYTVWHDLSHIINVTPQFFSFLLIYRVFPKATILECSPVPFIIFLPPCVVSDSCMTSSLWLERGKSYARRRKAIGTDCHHILGCFP